MNKDKILIETIDFAHKICDSFKKNKDLRNINSKFNLNYDCFLTNNYIFLDAILSICKPKRIEIPKAIGDFLLYDEELRKDIIYAFVLNCNISDILKYHK